jgi:hypothetical protein
MIVASLGTFLMFRFTPIRNTRAAYDLIKEYAALDTILVRSSPKSLGQLMAKSKKSKITGEICSTKFF